MCESIQPVVYNYRSKQLGIAMYLEAHNKHWFTWASLRRWRKGYRRKGVRSYNQLCLQPFLPENTQKWWSFLRKWGPRGKGISWIQSAPLSSPRRGRESRHLLRMTAGGWEEAKQNWSLGPRSNRIRRKKKEGGNSIQSGPERVLRAITDSEQTVSITGQIKVKGLEANSGKIP